MKKNIIGGMVVAFSIVLSGCGAQGQDSAAPTASDTPDEVTSSQGEETSTEPADEGSSEPAEVSSAPADLSAPVELPTDVPASVMLGDADLIPSIPTDRTETEGVAPWYYADASLNVPPACADEAAVPAEAMRTVVVTDENVRTGVEQVAVFADETQAAAELEKVTSLLEECAVTESGETALYSSEAFPVGGAEGFGFVSDFSQSFPDGATGDDAVGNYLGLVQRGNAITLVWNLGGEATVGDERALVTAQAAKAWPLLCRYDPAGC